MIELTAEQKESLRQYAQIHGRAWKSELQNLWRNGPSGTDPMIYAVYALRNTHGPRWLMKFKLGD